VRFDWRTGPVWNPREDMPDLNRKHHEVEFADREHEACLVAPLGLKCYSHISCLCAVLLLPPFRTLGWSVFLGE